MNESHIQGGAVRAEPRAFFTRAKSRVGVPFNGKTTLFNQFCSFNSTSVVLRSNYKSQYFAE